MNSWKTTAAGVAQFVAVLATQLYHLWDGVDSTEFDIQPIIASAMVLWGLLSARDNDKRSEDAIGPKLYDRNP